MKLVGMARVKNEARWIEKMLCSMLPICEHVFIFDDHSTDGTVEICESFERVTVTHSPFEGIDECRDKDALIEQVERYGADWILHLDGDEELESGSEDEILTLIENPGTPDAIRFQVLYLWNRPDQIRIDRWYLDFRRPSLFRLRPGARFHSNFSAGFHCGNTAGTRSIGNCNVRILHWGYMLKEDRIRKWKFYNAHDPKNVAEGYDPRYPERGSYPHMVIGDVPEVPADAFTRYAGPLELAPLKLRR